MATLTAVVRERGRADLLPAWVRITASDGRVVGDWNVHASLQGFPCDGEFTAAIPPGPVKVEVHRGLSHEWAVDEFVAEAGKTYHRAYLLAPWAPLRSQGWFCGDSHNHIDAAPARDGAKGAGSGALSVKLLTLWPSACDGAKGSGALNIGLQTPAGLLTPADVARYCRALGLDYLDVCQDWILPGGPGTSGRALQRGYDRLSTDSFRMQFGAERPKARFGHTWWRNLPPFDDPFAERLPWHDLTYFEEAINSTGRVDDIAAQFPFRNELPFKTWKRYRDQGAACVAAHPTSWWMNRPDASLIATNIAAELPFALLAGPLVDAMVVMGYDADHIFYQNTWFHILNEGYDLPGVAETDGGLAGPHHVGQLLDYVQTPDGRYSPAGIVEGLRHGRVLLSSGPLVTLTVDGGRYGMGDPIPADGAEHVLDIAAWSASDPAEFLSFIVVYRNGELLTRIDLTAARPRKHELFLRVKEAGRRAWYVVKVYGSTFPERDVFFDVFRYAELCERERHAEYIQLTQVAMTNPVYFVPQGWAPPAAVVCDATIRVVDAATAAPLPGASVRAMAYEKDLATVTADAAGSVRLTLPPTAEIEVRAPGYQTARRSIFLDYRPVRDCIEHCFAGRWRSAASPLQPGQVPWSAFKFRELRAVLESIDWTIALARQ